MYAIDASRGGPRGRPARADQHRAADLLLRHLRGAAPGRGDRGIKAAIVKTYGRRGAEVVERNNAAVDRPSAALHLIEVPATATASRELPALVPADAPSSSAGSPPR